MSFGVDDEQGVGRTCEKQGDAQPRSDFRIFLSK